MERIRRLKTITVTVTDVNEAPVFTSSATFNGNDDTKFIFENVYSFTEAVKTTDLDINKVLSKSGDTIIIEVSLSEPITCPSNDSPFYKNSDNADSTLKKCTVVFRLLPRSYDGSSVTVESETDLIVASDRNDDYDASHFDLINDGWVFGDIKGSSVNLVDYLKWDTDDWNIPKRITVSINQDIEELSSTYLSTQINSASELYDGLDPDNIFPGQSFDASATILLKYVSPVSYSISNSDISIDPNNGELKFVNSVDIDNQSSFTATVTANDGVNSSTQGITISINANSSAPSFTSSATFSAPENQTTIGTVVASDAGGQSISYSISGSDASSMSINSSSGALTFNSAPDHETKNSYSVTATASDGTNSTTQAITVNVTDVNEDPILTMPTSITLHEFDILYFESISPLPEQVAVTSREACSETVGFYADGCTVGSYNGEDLYSPDYDVKYWVGENAPWYKQLKRWYGDGEYLGEPLDLRGTIFVGNAVVDDISNTNFFMKSYCDFKYPFDTIIESDNPPNNSIQTSTPDPFCWLYTGDIAGVYPDPGEAEMTAHNGYSDERGGPLADPLGAAVGMGDLTDLPLRKLFFNITPYLTGQSLPGLAWETEASASAFFASPGILDYEMLGMTSYNHDDFAGAIDTPTRMANQTGSLGNGEWGGNTGVVYCVVDERNPYIYYPVTTDIQIASRDSYVSCKRITIKVINGNDNAPVFTSATSFSINEAQTDVGTVTATDADGLHTWNEARDRVLQGEFIDTISYSISGTDADLFSIDSVSGKLEFKSVSDYEDPKDSDANNIYLVTITASDQASTSWNGTQVISGPLVTTQDVTVNVTDVDVRSPVFTSSATFSAAENQTAIGTVTATDANGDSVTFTVSGSELAITSAGVLTFASAPDYETKSSYTATVTASDGTNSTTQNITVNVTDVNENAPVFTSSATFSAAENQTAIGTVTATDADGDSVTFTVSGSELEITSAGVLTFASAPDYETKSSYTATVTASDGTNSTTQNITVNVTDVNENAPVFTSSATFSAAEIQTAIGTVTATDADGDSVTFTVSGSELAITSAGVLTFASAPDYETKSSYTATVTASDGTYTTTQSITVNVTDVNEAPVFTSSATFSAAENQTAIGTVTATDANGDSVTFTVSGSELAITSAGVLTFASAPDYETKSSYTATVTASDGTNTTTQSITVNVTDVNDNSPVFTSSATFSAAENQTAIGTVTATDADGDSVTFTVSYQQFFSNGSDLAITTAGVLTFKTNPDYETKSSYTAAVTASDGTNLTTQDITINVTDVIGDPAFTSSDTFSAAENQTAIGTVTATDADGDSVTFTVSGSELAITSAGVLTFASAPDYETKSFYTATVSASDGTNTITQAIIVNVTDVND